eukprot:TRINITY_DN12016_c0_g1_i1.p1 TRINITY_DN12016_c0_g1~~TRINITY_DN12016_c0_g1_i1.p1  ORF type:complete len:533 (+),score=63.28 TRINITY_DN12016_c0_g1_i1:67-1665(+)
MVVAPVVSAQRPPVVLEVRPSNARLLHHWHVSRPAPPTSRSFSGPHAAMTAGGYPLGRQTWSGALDAATRALLPRRNVRGAAALAHGEANGAKASLLGVGPMRKEMLALLAISCLNLIGFTTSSPITANLMQHFKLQSDVQVGIMASVFSLGRLCTTSVWPILSDYLGRRPVLVTALTGGGIGALLQFAAVALQWPFTVFLAARALAGVFSGTVPVVKAYIGERFDQKDVPRILAYREAASTFAFIFGPALGGFLASRVFSVPLLLSAVASLTAALLAARVLQGGGGRSARKKRSRGSNGASAADEAEASTVSVRGLLPLLLVSFVWNCTRSCFFAYCPLHLARSYALSTFQVGWLLTIMSMLVAFVQLGGFDRVRKQLGLRGTLLASAVTISFALAAMGSALVLPGSFLDVMGSGFPVFLVFWTAYSLAVGLMSPVVPALVVSAAPPGRFGAILGIESIAVNVGRVVSPPLFGYFGFQYSLRCLAVALTISSVIFALAQRRASKGDADSISEEIADVPPDSNNGTAAPNSV